jgi:serine/threonine protein kinase
MGEVYEARDHSLNELIALKTLSSARSTDSAWIKSFPEELKKARRVSHRNVCRLYDFFQSWDSQETPLFFFTMELLNGKTLAETLKVRPQFGLSRATSVLSQVAAGLDAAHSSGVAHLDLKPGNIFLEGQDPNTRAVITDFGLSRRFSHDDATISLSSVQVRGGTPGYMAPEQYREGKVTPAADIYALGVIARKLIFDTGSVASAPVPKGSNLRNWSRAITKATASDPRERFKTASEFVAACVKKPPLSRRKVVLYGVSATTGILAAALVQQQRRPTGRILVRPFAPDGGTEAYWSNGLAQAVIRILQENSGVSVFGFGTSIRYSGNWDPRLLEANKLTADWLVSGSLRLRDRQLQLHAQLLDAKTSAVAWSTTLQRPDKEFSALCADVADQIGRQLSDVSVPRTPYAKALATNPEALEHYLRGRAFEYQGKPDGLLSAKEEFEAALAVDRNFALASCALADTLSSLADRNLEAPPSVMPRAKGLALGAVRANPSLAEGHVSLGQALTLGEYDWTGAEQSFQRAVAIAPSLALARRWYSCCLIKVGHKRESLFEAREGLRSDPLSSEEIRHLGLTLFWCRQYQEALDAMHGTTDGPGESSSIDEITAECYARAGNRPSATREADLLLTKQDANNSARSHAAVAYAILGMRDVALHLATELSQATHSRPTLLARIWAALGRPEEAFYWLEKGLGERDTMLPLIGADDCFEGLRRDPRYGSILARLGLGYPAAT